jgi:xanthine dehydrogenase small subunit
MSGAPVLAYVAGMSSAPVASTSSGCVERPIRFVHCGRITEVRDIDTTRTLLDWLREEAGVCGTKEGCAEGDCGACTVLTGELREGALRWHNVNACIQFLPMLDGKAVLTVEDLAPAARACGHELHPAQQAMVDCHGSQCGFCTPGFVMSLVHVYERGHSAGAQPTRQVLSDDLSGNLCRCTGYRPILDAGERMFTLPPVALDEAPIVAALSALAKDPPLAYTDAQGAVCHLPRTVEQLASLCESLPHARLLAGCTDIGLWVNKLHKKLPALISTTGVAELTKVDGLPDGGLWIGAGVTLEEAWSTLAEHHPAVHEMWLRFASPPVRHAGTLGGNLANGSPIGDGAPVLLALNARLLLRHGARERELPLDAFYLDYMKNALEAGEFIQAIIVPPASYTALRAYKLSKRFDSDISGLSAGLALTLNAQGEVSDARFAFGGMAAIVKRAAHAEAAVRGRPWSEATARAAAAALAYDYTPITDLRAGASYRQRTAANLLIRLWLQTREQAPLPDAATTVWARKDSLRAAGVRS